MGPSLRQEAAGVLHPRGAFDCVCCERETVRGLVGAHLLTVGTLSEICPDSGVWVARSISSGVAIIATRVPNVCGLFVCVGIRDGRH
jgi:hypothetical protein